MSLKITVNGKFNRSCGKRSILDDPVVFKKQLEEERRKQRLQEVREESKNLARKIRNDVAAEKERQLRKLEAIKAEELECWRQHVLTQKNHDYRSAIFQVGTAHHAAKAENETIAAKHKAKAERYKDFRKKLKVRRDNEENRHSVANKTLQTATTQTPKVLMKDKKKKFKKSNGKKPCCKNVANCNCGAVSVSDGEDTENFEEEKSCTESTSTSAEQVDDECPTPPSCCTCCTCTSASGSSCSEEEEEEEDVARTRKVCRPKRQVSAKLCTNPPVVVQVDVDSNESVTVTCENEFQREKGRSRSDHGTDEESPRKSAEESSEPHHSSPKRTKAKAKHQRTPVKKTISQLGAKQRMPGKKSSAKKVTTPRAPTKRTVGQVNAESKSPKKIGTKPRYTQVSDLIGKKKTTKDGEKQLPTTPPPSMRTTSPERSIRKSSGSAKSSGITMTISGGTVTLGGASSRETAAGENDCSSKAGHVQFYDYNNKYCREYAQPVHAVHASARDYSQPNAMEQACVERQLERTRANEAERMRCRSAERGEKALEREQVRRDCMELTQKLDALTKQYPDLLPPNDAKLIRPHQYAAQAARKEQKLNATVEDMLIRPAVITCPEVHRTQHHEKLLSSTDDELNLGAPRAEQANSSSESCGSILLDYVDEQRQQLRTDLNECETRPENEEQSARLKRLLQRVEDLRKALCAELSVSSTTKPISDHVQNVIDGVSDVRRERERILTDEAIAEGTTRGDALKQQRKEMESKEALLEQKLRELYKMQNTVTGQQTLMTAKKTQKTTGIDETKKKNPLEIVIRVKGDVRGRKAGIKARSKTGKSPRKISTLIENQHISKERSSSTVQEKVQASSGQNSYDSNSTAYCSLPPRISNQVENVVEQIEEAKEQANHDKEEKLSQDNERDEEETSKRPGKIQQRSSRLNPLIAHYVQRLLGMSRSSVKALGVDSSGIETPGSSIINTSKNIGGSLEDLAQSQERLERVQQFINDNRSFINDLEESLRSHSNASLDSSMRLFEDIWKQRLQKKSKKRTDESTRAEYGSVDHRDSRGSVQTTKRESQMQRKTKAITLDDNPARRNVTKTVDATAQPQPAPRSSGDVTTRDSQKKGGSQQRQLTPEARTYDKSVETVPTVGLNAEQQIERYAQLTDNCTQRIAELTALINKVREEKQRLMEVTLSSVSDGRNSTEYKELPDGQRRSARTSDAQSDDGNEPQTQSQRVQTSTENSAQNSPQQQPTSSLEQLTSEQVPLEKNKHIGISRDSGISMSRPVTAQDVEPPSLTSTSSIQQRKTKPPPTLQRYSPQLIEDEVAHELSTIVEVDTPITSRRPQGSTDSGKHLHVSPQAVPFPTFEQYAQELNLDVTQLDPETSMRMQQEFEDLIANLQAAKDNVPNYQAFPSLSAYLRNLTAHETGNRHCQSPETIEDLLDCLRVANLTIKSFPSRHEYMRQLAANSTETPLLDTASLENITEGPTPATETESESMNIEEELLKRNILQRSFRSVKTKKRVLCSTRRDGGDRTYDYERTFASESGIEKLSSTSDNASGDLERDLLYLGIKWPTAMRQKAKEAEARSGNTSSSTPDPKPVVRRPMQPATATSSPSKQSRGVLADPRNFSQERHTNSSNVQEMKQVVSPERVQHASRGDAAASRSLSPTIQQRQTTHVRHSSSPSPENRHKAYRPVPVQPHSAPQSPVRMQQMNRGATGTKRSSSQSPDQRQRISRGVTAYPHSTSPSPDCKQRASTVNRGTHEAQRSQHSSHSSDDCGFLSDLGRPLNLRDFLTKELLKRVSHSSSSSTDDSLRSQFLQSIIESLTPRTNTGGNNLERQKTSTPVTHSGQSRSSENNSSSSPQLFSGESRISSVHYQERRSSRNYRPQDCQCSNE